MLKPKSHENEKNDKFWAIRSTKSYHNGYATSPLIFLQEMWQPNQACATSQLQGKEPKHEGMKTIMETWEMPRRRDSPKLSISEWNQSICRVLQISGQGQHLITILSKSHYTVQEFEHTLAMRTTGTARMPPRSMFTESQRKCLWKTLFYFM